MQQFWHLINEVELTSTTAIVRIVLSLVLGSLVGIERKRKGQMAGLRTFSLISMGACIAMMLSIYVCQETVGLLRGDPSRIAAQVLSGIGFLGAGTIIQMKGSVRGLTTAAGIWMVAALGLTVGVGMYVIATVATILILFILWVLERIEHRMSANFESRILNIHTASVVQDITPYRNLLKERHVSLTNFFISVDYEANTSTLNLVVLVPETTDLTDLFNDIRRISPTRGISLANQTTF